jgi:hypothetical protein
MRNKRLMNVAEIAVRMGLTDGKYQLDGYNQKVVTNGISITITTRISASAQTYLLEIDERCDSD